MRLHGADWNDALDMAWEKGESVAFTCAYAGNLQKYCKNTPSVGRNQMEVRNIEIAHEME